MDRRTGTAARHNAQQRTSNIIPGPVTQEPVPIGGIESKRTRKASGTSQTLSRLDSELDLEEEIPPALRTTNTFHRYLPPDWREEESEITSSHGTTDSQTQSVSKNAGMGRLASVKHTVSAWVSSVEQHTSRRPEPEPDRVSLKWGKKSDNRDPNITPGRDLVFMSGTGPSDSQSCVVWQHCSKQAMVLDDLSELRRHSRVYKISEHEYYLISRTKTMLEKTALRKYSSGNYLKPTVQVYYRADTSNLTPDSACAFSNFPYFSVAPWDKRVHSVPDVHPLRSLLQTKFLLTKTTDGDLQQFFCRKTSKGWSIPFAHHSLKNSPGDIIYVPQLWSLTVGTGALYTFTNDTRINTNILQRERIPPNASEPSLSVVRIKFFQKDRLQMASFSIDLCRSWFGLLNKCSRILEYLNPDHGGSDPKKRHYIILKGEEQISEGNWHHILEKHKNKKSLELRIKVPSEYSAGKEAKTQENSTISEHVIDEETHAPEYHQSSSHADLSARLDYFVPFLCWPVVDDDGERVKNSRNEEINHAIIIRRTFNSILGDLPAVLKAGDSQVAQQSSTANVSINDNNELTTEDSKLVMVEPKTKHLCWDLRNDQSEAKDTEGAERSGHRQSIIELCQQFWNIYVPEEDWIEDLEIYKLFWGIVYLIVDPKNHQLDVNDLEKIHSELQGIVRDAMKLHRGALSLVLSPRANQQGDEIGNENVHGNAEVNGMSKAELAEGAVLLAVIVDAFNSTFKGFIQIAQMDRSKNGSKANEALGRFKTYKMGVIELLKKAETYLIADADVRSQDANLGPFVTPETILIKLLSRLSKGYSGEGTIDIINAYDECFQKLAMEVSTRPTRALLRRVNEFEQQVEVITDVVAQQQRVLAALKDNLDPEKNAVTSVTRHINFAFEKRAIDDILNELRHSREKCAELRKRTIDLARQNLYAVEALQDKMNTIVLLFTAVTLIFLPLSFISGYFGMNLVDLPGEHRTQGYFWKVAGPTTAGVIAIGIYLVWISEKIVHWLSIGKKQDIDI